MNYDKRQELLNELSRCRFQTAELAFRPTATISGRTYQLPPTDQEVGLRSLSNQLTILNVLTWLVEADMAREAKK